MFSRLDKFDGPIFEGAYIRDVSLVTFFGDVYSVGGILWCVLTGFYGMYL